MPLNMIPRRTAGKIAPAKTGKKQKARQSLGMPFYQNNKVVERLYAGYLHTAFSFTSPQPPTDSYPLR